MSILNRKRDLVYLIFFLIHIPVIFCVDLYSLYPDSLRPQFMKELREFYIDTYRDQFFISPPAWFMMYMWMEALYHVPLSIWAIGALLRVVICLIYAILTAMRNADDPKVPVHLLIYAMQTAITTSTCIADYLSWSNFSSAEKIELGKLYVPYLALSVFMGVDMFGRLDGILNRRQTTRAKKDS